MARVPGTGQAARADSEFVMPAGVAPQLEQRVTDRQLAGWIIRDTYIDRFPPLRPGGPVLGEHPLEPKPSCGAGHFLRPRQRRRTARIRHVCGDPLNRARIAVTAKALPCHRRDARAAVTADPRPVPVPD